ncbi:MAG: outer membrane protein assembly factor BamD [Woeseiaceae bacterium]
MSRISRLAIVWSRRTLPLLAALAIAGCAGDAEEYDMVADIREAYETAEKARNGQNYRKAIGIYEALQARFPFSDFAKQIQLELLYCYYKVGRQEEAIAAADQFMRENPTHPRVDYALYIKGLTYFEREPNFLERWFRRDLEGRPPRDGELAFSLFKRLVERYPASLYAEDAEQRMVYLKNRLAAYENTVARFYLERGAYVAALNRAKGAIEQYNGAESGRESLLIMAEAYEGLGMMDLAEDTRRVIRSNFPNEG